LTPTVDTTLSNPSVISSTCGKFQGFVSRDSSTTDMSPIPHGTFMAGIVSGQAPVLYPNATEASYWQGIAPDSKIFFVRMYSVADSKIYIPASLQAGFLKWVLVSNRILL
jgi:hypothetical protein